MIVLVRFGSGTARANIPIPLALGRKLRAVKP
jgi:hypothetical protein